MATLDSLPGDQRAVLQLVLGRGRSYEEIARVLTIEPAAVRDRARSALDALAPPADLRDVERASITDFMLGQLPEDDAASVRRRLAADPAARAWAQTLRGALAPLSPGPLPEVPDEAGSRADAPPSGPTTPLRSAPPAEPVTAPPPTPATDAPSRRAPAAPTAPDAPAAPAAVGKRSSRLGGAIVIAVTVVVIAAVVVLVVLRTHHHHSSSVADNGGVTTTNPASSSSGSGTTTSSQTSATPIAQINLHPTASAGKAVAIAFVYQSGNERELVIEGQHIPANTAHSSYEVWLYNSQSDAASLGFVNPGVTSSGRLSTVSPLPSDAGHYRQLIITTETASKPKTPGPITFSGQISGL